MALISFLKVCMTAIKCSLRNDILAIYEQCKTKEEITEYQLDAVMMSAELYFKLKGNSFIKAIIEKIKMFKIID